MVGRLLVGKLLTGHQVGAMVGWSPGWGLPGKEGPLGVLGGGPWGATGEGGVTGGSVGLVVRVGESKVGFLEGEVSGRVLGGGGWGCQWPRLSPCRCPGDPLGGDRVAPQCPTALGAPPRPPRWLRPHLWLPQRSSAGNDPPQAPQTPPGTPQNYPGDPNIPCRNPILPQGPP